MDLNARALVVAEELARRADEFRVGVRRVPGGGMEIDCGIAAPGGLAAGLMLARACLADLADVSIVPGAIGEYPGPRVQVQTDHPVAACLASQYAGWAIQVKDDKFFAMGSGPMRSAYGGEPIFETIGHKGRSGHVVGILEGRKPATAGVFAKIAAGCEVPPEAVTLLVAPTASLAGGVQIVARSVETALHKLAELKFDLTRLVSAHGVAPLPPVAKDDLAAIGRTNDAVLYGGHVTLYVTGDDDSLAEIGPKVPSTASPDHGAPFAEVFARYGHDFYKVDPHLFSPAEVVFQNVQTGRSHRFGGVSEPILLKSFFGDS
jgi:methenyltetrahydromethanopterin cyclohydrolase